MATDSKTKSSARFLRRTFLGTLAALLALAVPAQTKAQARKIELGDAQKIVGITDPEISPDGKSIVIVVSHVNWDEDRNATQPVLVDPAAGGQTRDTTIRKGS